MSGAPTLTPSPAVCQGHDVTRNKGAKETVSRPKFSLQKEDLDGRMVVIVANLKPRNMRGIKSNGMLLCTSNPDHSEVEPLCVPEGAVVGERVFFGESSEQPDAMSPNQVQKKKVWEAVSEVSSQQPDTANANELWTSLAWHSVGVQGPFLDLMLDLFPLDLPGLVLDLSSGSCQCRTSRRTERRSHNTRAPSCDALRGPLHLPALRMPPSHDTVTRHPAWANGPFKRQRSQRFQHVPHLATL